MFDAIGDAGKLQCRDYKKSAFDFCRITSKNLAQFHCVLAVLFSCGEAGLFVRVHELVRDLPHQFILFLKLEDKLV